MIKTFRHLWLAIALITGASAILLYSDLEQRKSARANKHDYPEIAIMQISSTPLLDNHVKGVIDGLASRGYVSAGRANLHLFNPQGDMGTANTIAREIVNGPYDLVITSSTLALQTVANANKSTRKTHIFGAVTDPYGTGVGISGPGPSQHPPYLIGTGSFQPVEKAIRILKQMNPQIKRLGVVWNSGEQCSEACVLKARAICRELDIELVEAIASNTSEVSEATRSLIAKGVEAIWVGGDTVAIAALGTIISQCSEEGIPVITNDPVDAEAGALFGLGANYYTVGQYTAALADSILQGKDPAEMPIIDVLPELLHLNPWVLSSMGNHYRLTSDIEALLAASEASENKLQQDAQQPFRPDHMLKLSIVHYSETEFAERCHEGLIDGIKKAGLVEGRDYELVNYNAQGDMSTLSSIMSNIKSDQVDLLMVISTPTLQAALRQAGSDTKIVFTGVGDGVKAGAGKSESDHLPNVTGISTRSPFEGMAKLISTSMPHVRRAGTLFTPAEINSVLYKDWFREELAKYNIELLALPVTSSAEVSQVAAELCRQDIQLVSQIVDNLTRPGFALIARKASENNLPVFVFDSDQMKEGATLCLARDYYDAGLEAAEKAIRVLKGESPGDIPFSNTKSEKLLYNEELLNKLGINPDDLGPVKKKFVAQ